MKLSTVFAKLTTGNTKVLTALGSLAIAGAVCTLAAPAANAQQFGIGVQFGGPRYVAPAPVYGGYAPAYVEPRYGYAPGYWQDRRAEEWRAHEWREREAREHAFRDRDYGYRGGYSHDGWR